VKHEQAEDRRIFWSHRYNHQLANAGDQQQGPQARRADA
jgi:hypothetical protein